MSAGQPSVDWASVIADAYAAEARPPLTQELVAQIRAELASALETGSSDQNAPAVSEIANKALDEFESALRSVVGPRVESVDEAAGSAIMKHRSEAGRPMRAYGGQ